MHNVTAPALHEKCLSCTLSRSALGASLCIDVFPLQKSISAKQYLTASLWVSTKNYVRIMSGKCVLYHPMSMCHVFRLSHCLCLIALWQNIAGLVVVLPMLTMVVGGGHLERKAENKEGESSLQQISVDRPMLI